jgi:serine/threonine-protein kinase HipA
MLAAYGRDVAGAVQVIDPGASDAADPPRARALSTPDIVELLDDVAAFPLGDAPMTGKACAGRRSGEGAAGAGG